MTDVLALAYAPLLHLADTVDEPTGWLPTRLPGWSVRDLLLHLAHDAQRALVALGTPADGAADTDEVSYWSAWQPGTDGALAGLRGTRIQASAWSAVRGPADLFRETARAVLVLAARSDPDEVVSTQGRRLTVASLVHTLTVEAAVHTLDLPDGASPDAPHPAALDRVRHALDGLLGRPVPDVDDLRYARIGTDRAELTADERHRLGPLADRFPLFG